MLGEIASWGLLTSLSLLLLKTNLSRFWKAIAIMSLPVCSLALIMAGSRASILGVIILIFLLSFILQLRFKFAITVIIGSIFIGMLIFLIIFFPEKVPANITKLTQVQFGEQMSESRTYLWKWALERAPESMPFGHGVGSFAVDKFNTDIPVWPHNIIIEAFYELGFFATACLVGLLTTLAIKGWIFIRDLYDAHEKLLVAVPFSCMLFMYIQAMIDPDISGARQVYLLAGITFAVISTLKAEHQQLTADGIKDEKSLIYEADFNTDNLPAQSLENLNEY